MKGFAPYLLTPPLPDLHSAEWDAAARYIARRLDSALALAGQRAPAPGRVLAIHPSQPALFELARSLYNGEIAPAEDGDGVAQPLPRVWCLDVDGIDCWLIETTGPAEARRLAAWDRQQSALAA